MEPSQNLKIPQKTSTESLLNLKNPHGTITEPPNASWNLEKPHEASREPSLSLKNLAEPLQNSK